MIFQVLYDWSGYGMVCSHTLQQMDVSNTSLQFAALFLSPFLTMGATRAVLHWWGILPVSRDVVNLEVRWGATSSANLFSTFGDILSDPLALFILSPFSSLVTPAWLMLRFSMTGWGLKPFNGMSPSSLLKMETYCSLHSSWTTLQLLVCLC